MVDETQRAAAGKRAAGKRIIYAALIFALGFGLALLLAWAFLVPPAPPPEPAARTVRADDLREFFQAVEREDYEALKRIGEELLPIGARVPDSAAVFADYAVASYPPHQVYALLTRIGTDSSQRVLLTMNENDTVESFLAEEMPIAR